MADIQVLAGGVEATLTNVAVDFGSLAARLERERAIAADLASTGFSPLRPVSLAVALLGVGRVLIAGSGRRRED